MFYMVSFARGYFEGGESDDYSMLGSDVKTVEGVHNIVNGHRVVNNLTEEGYEHFYNISECYYDSELEGGFGILGSMNYDEWIVENPDRSRG